MPKAPNPDDVYTGFKVRLQRRMLNMSQTALANALDITFQQIQKYEKGTNRISASRLQTISGVFGVPISFFFRSADDEPQMMEGIEASNGSLTHFIATGDGLKLNRAFIAIKNEKVRRSVVALIKALAEGDQLPDGQINRNHAMETLRAVD